MPASDLFAGTAEYYARYRPPYPEPLLQDLVAKANGGGRNLVDLGSGTGEVAIPLSRHFASVLAIDFDAEMISVAKEKAASLEVDNVRWVVSRAEDVDLLPAESCQLITAGASFHWMDRAVMAPRCYNALVPTGIMAVLGTNNAPWEPTEPWHEIVITVIKRWLGDSRRAGSQHYSLQLRHEDFLGPAGFQLQHLEYRVEHSWTPDSYIGFLYSTSYAGIAILGDAREGFENDMREELIRCSPDGMLKETIPVYAIVGTKD
jgi:ubiquinone/menaquinone biosynthesis C-methylase UbiE